MFTIDFDIVSDISTYCSKSVVNYPSRRIPQRLPMGLATSFNIYLVSLHEQKPSSVLCLTYQLACCIFRNMTDRSKNIFESILVRENIWYSASVSSHCLFLFLFFLLMNEISF